MQLGDTPASYRYGTWSTWPHCSNEEMPGRSHEMFFRRTYLEVHYIIFLYPMVLGVLQNGPTGGKIQYY